jgi:membrane-associated phospholipid phosphatase
MQGGHPDGLRLRFGRVDRAGSGDSHSGYESETVVEDLVSLGSRLDSVVGFARSAFGEMLALPVAWVQLQPTVDALRSHKLMRVAAGIDFVLWIQTFRTKQLDLVMQVFSFCAEEEFYLLILPLLFWNGYYELARRLTFVVVTGLFVGNIIKDVYELPRPSSPPVWRPSNQEHLDSTALQDFGFPSTHAMNAVSNSVLAAWFFWDPSREINSAHNLALICGVVIWITALSFSRMYLGAHTGTDVRGGLGLGVLVIASYLHFHLSIDAALSNMTPSGLFLSVLVLAVVGLLLCPQPRPPTPTFNQNALLMGLFWGLVFGARVADDYGLSIASGFGLRPSEKDAPILRLSLPVVRTILGFVLTILMRVVVKAVTVGVVEGVFGIKTKPKEEVVRRRARGKKGKKVVIKLFTRDIDIIAVAFVKTMTYLATAATITFVFPYSFELLSDRIAPMLLQSS